MTKTDALLHAGGIFGSTQSIPVTSGRLWWKAWEKSRPEGVEQFRQHLRLARSTYGYRGVRWQGSN